jgi:hypothetical protein
MYISDFDLYSVSNRDRKFLTSIENSLIEAAKLDSYFDNMDLTLIKILGHIQSVITFSQAVVWAANQYKKKKFKMVDIVRYRDVLDLYFELLDESVSSCKALFQLKSVEDVEEFIKNKFGSISKNEIEKNIKDNESERILDVKGLLIIKPLTASAAKIYGKGTKWCVSGSIFNEFSKHASKGNLYFVFLNKRKFCFHVENGQFMNELNEIISTADIKELLSSDEFMKFFRTKKDEYRNNDYFKFLEKLGLA